MSSCLSIRCIVCFFFFFQAEDGIRDLVRSRGLGDVYKRQSCNSTWLLDHETDFGHKADELMTLLEELFQQPEACLLYTSDAADERSSVDLGGRRIIKKKTELTIKR